MSSGFAISAHTNLHIALGSIFTTTATSIGAGFWVPSGAIRTEVTFIHIKYLQTGKLKQLAIYHITEVFLPSYTQTLTLSILGDNNSPMEMRKTAHFRPFTAYFIGFMDIFSYSNNKSAYYAPTRQEWRILYRSGDEKARLPFYHDVVDWIPK